MLKTSTKLIAWRDSAGRERMSFPWRLADEQSRDECGLDNWERAGFFGAYRCDKYQEALTIARERLISRGFDPASAESLVAPFKDSGAKP